MGNYFIALNQDSFFEIKFLLCANCIQHNCNSNEEAIHETNYTNFKLSQVSTLKAGDSPRMILQKTQSFWSESLGCWLVLVEPAPQMDLETGICRVGEGPEPGRRWEQRMESLRDSI